MKKIFALAALMGVAQAHHSFSAFDRSKYQTVSGTVKFFEFTNPHVWIWLTVPGVGLYGFESGGPSQYDRMGIARDTFAPGTKVAITFHPLRDGRMGGSLVSAKFPNGETLDMMKQVRIFASGEVRQ